MTDSKFYAASLSAYNSGRLHGAWIDLSTDVDEMQEAVSAMLAACPEHGEEWAVHDYDDCPDCGEYPGLARLAAVAELIEEYDSELVKATIDNVGHEYAASELSDRYRGTYDSVLAYAEEILDGSDDLPKGELRYYFDWDAYCRDLAINETILDLPSGSVAVFSG